MENELEYEKARSLNYATLSNNAFYLINKKLLKYFNGDWELCGLLSRFLEIENQCIIEYSGKDKMCQQGYFFHQKSRLEKETYLHFNKQTNITNTLIQHELLKVEKTGQPAMNYYKINHIKLQQIMSLHDDEISSQLDSKSLPNQLTSQLDSKPLLNNNIITNNIDKDTKVSFSPTDSTKPLLTEFVDLQNKEKTYKEVEEIFDYWCQFGKPLSIPKKNLTKPTQTLQEVFITISKELKRLSKQKIKEAIYWYYEMISTPDKFCLHCEDPLHLVDISNFFKFNDFLKKKQISAKEYNLAKNIKSWYWECAQGEKYLLKQYGRKQQQSIWDEPIEDIYPQLTYEFKRIWKNKMAIDTWYSNGNGIKDENCFRKSSIFLMKFINKHRNILKNASLPYHEDGAYGDIDRPASLIYDFIAAIDLATQKFPEGEKITPGWLCGGKMEDRLLHYYREQGVISTGYEEN